MRKLSAEGKYQLSSDDFSLIKESFVGYSASEDDTRKTVKDTYENKNCLIDTHTAVAVYATNRYIDEYKAERKILAVSTASPYKFANDVFFALTNKEARDDLSALSELSELTGEPIPAPLKSILNKPVIHTRTIQKEEMDSATLDFAKNQ
jgi:threonine synthase